MLRLPRRAIRPLASAVLGTACLAYVGATFAWSSVSAALGAADLLLLVGGGGGSILAVWLTRTLRWHLLVRQLGLQVRFRDLYYCTALALGLATVTPLQSGELIKLRLLRRYTAVDLTQGLGTFAAERAADLLVIALFALAAMLLLPPLMVTRFELVPILGVLAIAALVLNPPVATRLLPKRARGLLAALSSTRSTPGVRTRLFLLTVVCWGTTAAGWQVSLRSVGVEIDLVQSVALVCVVTLVNVLSLVPGGLGVSEVSTAAFLGQLGISAPEAQAGALAIRVYGLMILVLSVFHLLVVSGWRNFVADGVPG